MIDRTAVGADDEFVRVFPELVLPEHQAPGAETHNRRGARAGFLERPQLREDRGDAEAAADKNHMLCLADMLRQAERTDEILDGVAGLVLVAHFARRLAERLDDDGHEAFFA